MPDADASDLIVDVDDRRQETGANESDPVKVKRRNAASTSLDSPNHLNSAFITGLQQTFVSQEGGCMSKQNMLMYVRGRVAAKQSLPEGVNIFSYSYSL
jgi:hypothetical protein